ncbi:Nn.00g014180.m01.CDS01 [Neocucurbitaria sp. VM-36]
MSEQTSGSSGSTDPVAWQTIYFILVALGACTAAQPSGRVAGIPSRYAMYLRVSPFVCVADIVSTPLYIAWNCIIHGTPAKTLLGHLLDYRFDEDGEDGNQSLEESVQTARKVAVFRWLWFVFSGLLPAIKLIAMAGVPVSKVWAIMLLASFVSVEVLISLQQRRVEIQCTRLDDRRHSPGKDFFLCSICTAILMQVTTFSWANAAVLDIMILGPGALSGDITTKVMISYFLLFYEAIVVVIPAFFLYDYYFRLTFRRSVRGRACSGILVHLLAGCWVLLGTGSSYILSQIAFHQPWYPRTLVPFWLAVVALTATFEWIKRRWPKVADYVLPDTDYNAWNTFAFTFLLLHVFVPLAWYAVAFNSRGTYTASWTSVFG